MIEPPASAARHRWSGLVRLAARRAAVRATSTGRGQTRLSVLGVASAIALMLLVTSIGVGLTQPGPVVDGGVEYTIEPAAGATSTVVEVDRPRLGRVHAVTARVSARDDVDYATPVLMSLVKLAPPDGPARTVLLIGVIPPPTDRTIVGLPTAPLSPGDPHYAEGGFDGRWTGEAVVSEAAARRLGVTPGTTLSPEGDDPPFGVTAISPARRAGLGQFPVAIVHLGELQTITGAASADAADRILVDATADIEPELATLYPESVVLTRGELFRGGLDSRETQLPLAISLTAFVVAIVVGSLFMMTTMGFQLAADSRQRAVLAAIGLSRGSRVTLVVLQALVVSVLGGLAGIGLWLVGLVLTNAAATTVFGTGALAAFRPVFAAYGLAVALLIGISTVPYLLIVSRRSSLTAALPI